MTIIGRKAWEAICAVEGIAPLSDADHKFLDSIAGLPSHVRVERVLKHIRDSGCSNDCCMPGLGGKCTGCADEQ